MSFVTGLTAASCLLAGPDQVSPSPSGSSFLVYLILYGKITMVEMSKILVIGGTGYIGKFIVAASAKAGHPTYALVRESTVSDPAKSEIMESFKSCGVKFVYVRARSSH